MLLGLLLQAAAAQPLPVIPVQPVPPDPIEALARLSPAGHEAVRQSMADWAPLGAEEREQSTAAEREAAAAASSRPVDLSRLRSALEERDRVTASWRARRTRFGLELLERMSEPDRAIVASILPAIVAPQRRP